MLNSSDAAGLPRSDRVRGSGYPVNTYVDDLHVAAHARSEGLVIVTNHRREFDRVPALQVEDWSL